MSYFEYNNLINNSIRKYSNFLDSFYSENLNFKLTKNSDISPFARCFWIFGMHLIGRGDHLKKNKDKLSRLIINDIRDLKKSNNSDFLITKHYRQLVCFSLSALSILNYLDYDPLEDLIIELVPKSIKENLDYYGCFYGKEQSGNHAMFIAIFLLHLRKYLNISNESLIYEWVNYHLDSINSNGFWGTKKNITYLQFQNGYHQYEIFEYLKIKPDVSIGKIERFADKLGQFSPYPGGGGCYDYDAIFLLTNYGRHEVLIKTLITLLSIQNADGGFSESREIRPRSLRKIVNHIKFCFSNIQNTDMFFEKLRILISLQLPKNNTISTHWTNYSREWGESNLWDSWFRMLSIARIDMTTSQSFSWGFINYPGIGYHYSLINDK